MLDRFVEGHYYVVTFRIFVVERPGGSSPGAGTRYAGENAAQIAAVMATDVAGGFASVTLIAHLSSFLISFPFLPFLWGDAVCITGPAGTGPMGSVCVNGSNSQQDSKAKSACRQILNR